jgi:hypothetical protein
MKLGLLWRSLVIVEDLGVSGQHKEFRIVDRSHNDVVLADVDLRHTNADPIANKTTTVRINQLYPFNNRPEELRELVALMVPRLPAKVFLLDDPQGYVKNTLQNTPTLRHLGNKDNYQVFMMNDDLWHVSREQRYQSILGSDYRIDAWGTNYKRRHGNAKNDSWLKSGELTRAVYYHQEHMRGQRWSILEKAFVDRSVTFGKQVGDITKPRMSLFRYLHNVNYTWPEGNQLGRQLLDAVADGKYSRKSPSKPAMGGNRYVGDILANPLVIDFIKSVYNDAEIDGLINSMRSQGVANIAKHFKSPPDTDSKLPDVREKRSQQN